MKAWSLEAFALAWAASASAASARASACVRAARKAMISFRGEPAFMAPVYPKASQEIVGFQVGTGCLIHFVAVIRPLPASRFSAGFASRYLPADNPSARP